jgi:hypothetical protein
VSSSGRQNDCAVMCHELNHGEIRIAPSTASGMTLDIPRSAMRFIHVFVDQTARLEAIRLGNPQTEPVLCRAAGATRPRTRPVSVRCSRAAPPARVGPNRLAAARSISAIAIRGAMTPLSAFSRANMDILLRTNGVRAVDQDRLTVCTDPRWAFRPHRPYYIQPPLQTFPKLPGADILGTPQLVHQAEVPQQRHALLPLGV